jgi:hypothetical protein
MWYFWPELAFDLVKGLVAGGASLALQAVAPVTRRALKRFRARWCARKAARKSWSNTSASSPHERMRYAVIDQDPGCRCAHPGYAGSTIL